MPPVCVLVPPLLGAALVLLHGRAPDDGWPLIAAALAASLAGIWRWRHHAPRGRGVWLLLALAPAVPAAAALLSPTPGFDDISTGVELGMLALLIAAALAAARLRARDHDPLSWIDALSVSTAAAMPLYIWGIVPAGGTGEGADPLIPVLQLVMVTVGTRALLGAGRWNPSWWLAFAGYLAVLAASVGFHLALAYEAYEPGHPADAALLLGFALFGAAALHGSAPHVLDRGPRRRGLSTRGRLGVLVFNVMVPVLTISLAHVDGRSVDVLSVLVPLALLVILACVRVVVAARRGSKTWQATALLSTVGLLVTLLAFGLTRTQPAADRHRDHADHLIDATVRAERAGGLAARALSDPLEAKPLRVLEIRRDLAAIDRTIARLPRERGAVDRAGLQRLAREYARSFDAGLALVRAGRLDEARAIARRSGYVTLDQLRSRLAQAARIERGVADGAARDGRVLAVVLMLLTLGASFALLLRFGSLRRRALLSAERNRIVEQNERRFRALIGGSADIITVADEHGTLIEHPETAERVLGYPAGALLGARLADLMDAADAGAAAIALEGLRGRPGAQTTLTCRLRRADGQGVESEMTIANRVDDADIGGYVLNIRDVSERVLLEAKLEHQSQHDGLTGLPNRGLIERRLLEASSGRGGVQAMVMVDLNDFKAINDTFGYATGDLLLIEVARRLRGCLSERDTLARVGGDEFAVLLHGVGSPEDAVQLARRLVGTLAEPVDLGGHLQVVRASAGVAVGDCDGAAPRQRADHLLRDAELAMYEAKSGGDNVRLFESELHDAVLRRLELRTQLERAIAREEFELHYQPIVDLASGEVAGYEALVRWNHPERGLVPPGEFIPVAEASGLIVEIGAWVLHEACRQLAAWRGEWAGERYVSVNVAGQQLQRPGIVAEVRDALCRSGLPAELLLLEVTETGVIRDADEGERRLGELRALGVRLAIDDFGTGYSSLGYLHRLPFDVLKVDKSFVDRVATADAGRALVEAIVVMARSLQLSVVAEGIEYPEQAEALAAMGCPLAQGFHFSRPLPAADVPGFAPPAGEAYSRA